ncbi:MAG: site-specific integrase [Cyanobacteria bacterium P01_A01_bin.17]
MALLRVGSMIYFQATLPPKPGSQKSVPYQQKIATGHPASADGIKRAEAEAKLLDAALIAGTFDWADYRIRQRRSTQTVDTWVKKFEAGYRAQRQLKERTWQENWAKIFNRLPQSVRLEPEILIEQCINKPENSRIRQQTCQKLQALADFAGLEVDLLKYKGKYGPSKVEKRDLPDDVQIAESINNIPNPGWKWVFGAIAALGLRPHEAFFCHWTNDGLQISKGKTGPRLVFQAFYPEWVDEWGLRNIQLPKISAQEAYEKGRLGKMIRNQFRDRYKLPFPPYDLRHAYAIRSTVLFGVPETVSAQLMGHSPEVHHQIYHRWISLAMSKQAIDRVMSQPQRPKPPAAGSVLSPDA